MGFQMKTEGMEQISEMLSKLEAEGQKAAARGLYKGAGLMADEIRKGAANIKTADFKYASRGETRLPSPEEKEAVLSVGAGVAKFDRDGTEINTSVGYSNTGYAEVAGKMRPVPLIANAINSGTSFMQKQPFVRKAASSGGPKAEAAMRASIEADLSAITK